MYLVLSLAFNQTKFFKEVFGQRACYIVYDSDSSVYLESFSCKHILINRKSKDFSYEVNYTEPFEYQLRHELLNFRNRNLSQMCSTYYETLRWLNSLDFTPKLVLQELGGYVANKALYDWSLSKAEVRHYFVEPSFLRASCFI